MDARGHVYTSRAFDEDKMTCIMRRGEIWALHLWLNIHELMVTICTQAFHLRPWLKMKRHIEWSCPNLPIYTHVLQRCKTFLDAQAIKLFRILNPWISRFSLLLDWFLRPRSVWKWDFVEGIGRNFPLNSNFHFQNSGMRISWSGEQLDHFEHDFGLDFVYSS